MQQKQNCGHPLRRKGSISRVSKVTCGLLFCLTTGVFAAGENVELLTSDRIENAVPDQVGKTVTIMVQDEMGPVAGANVVVKGTTNGNISDMDGKVVLQNVPNNSTLVISFIGYTTQEVKVSNQATIHVKLVEDAKALEEVVVIGYGSLDKKQVTSAITSLKADDLMVGVSGADISASLQGKIGGLVMNNLGSANSGTTFQLRGMTSINSGKAPLIVIDGFPGGDIRSLTQDDIKSIDVLKDASSVAVYGAKAANGVVAITTKKGKTGKPVISFNANVGMVSNARLPKTVDGAGFIKFRQEYGESLMTEAEMVAQPGKFADPRNLAAAGIDPLAWYNYDQQTPVSALPDEKTMINKWLTRLNFKTIEIENYLNGVETDWDDIVYQTGLQQDYTVSLSNRKEDFSYYWSMGYADREGVKVGDRYRNLRTRLNLESKVTSFLTVGLNAQFATRLGGYLAADVEQREHNSPFTTNDIDILDSPYRMYPSGDNNTKNPFFDNLYRDRRDIHHDLNANLYAIVKLPFGFEYQMNFTPRYHWYEYMNHESAEHPEWAGDGGRSERKNEKTFNWQVDNILRWKKEFGEDHRVEATFLQNAEKGQWWKTVAQNKLYSPSDILGFHNIGAGTAPSVSSEDTYKTGDALMGRLFYSFKDKYMLTASVRRDGYSAFGSMNPHAVFPAVALGWVFTSEKFMEKTSDWLNYGKLRFSWGQNGNRDIGQYEALAQLNSGAYTYVDPNGNVYLTSQVYINRMPNSSLKWERTASYNIGLDFSLFGDKLSGSMETYMAESNDLLVNRSLPSILGYASVMANLGALTNRGFELSLNANLINRDNFSWNSTGTFSFNRRKIKHLYGDVEEVKDEAGNVIGYKEADDYENQWFIGHDTEQIWDYERDGVWQLGEEEEASKYGNKPGDFKYVDQNGDGVLDTKDKTFQGYKTPRYVWSWRNEFVFFKNLSLSFMMYSHIGQYGTFNRAANTGGMYDRYTIVDIPRWTKDNPTDDYARIGSTNKGNNYVKKTFVRMENITLSYSVPNNLLKKFSVQNMRFSLAVRNPFVITGWDFGDPEGGDTTLRTVNFGVNFTL